MAVTAERRRPRALMLTIFQRLPPRRQRQFHDLFGLMLVGRDPAKVAPGSWSVEFAGRSIQVPLGGEDAALLWVYGTSLVAHDLEIKQFYRKRLTSPRPPKVFYDIGASYGTHSLIFLTHGIRTISVEPNPSCHRLFRKLCAVNGVEPDIRAVAIGDHEGEVTLRYPPLATWLGTVRNDIGSELASERELVSVNVPMTTVDNLIAQGNPHPDIIKIDTEGNELDVLRGASGTLRTVGPVVIFESWPDSERQALATFFEELGYEIADLKTEAALVGEDFLQHPATNFFARPRQIS